MKKVLTALVAVLYLTISSGFVVNVHYCMGKISNVEIDNFSDVACTCSKPTKKSACCTNTFKVVKLEDVHKASVAITNFDAPAERPTVYSLFAIPHVVAVPQCVPAPGDPPELAGNIYLRNCVLRV